jgi:hypothetical protein
MPGVRTGLRSRGSTIRLLVFSFAAIAGLASAWAGTTGRISGTVGDSGGAVVAGAKVTATNASTGLKATVTSDKKGLYSFITLLPGVYDIAVDAKGFKPLSKPGVGVHVDSAVKVDLVLEPAN